jgi:Rhs element Vgr protein
MEELIIPNPSTHDVASYSILVEGQALNPSYQLLSLFISSEINHVPVAKIVLRDGEASERKFEISDKEELIPGKKLVIKIGFDGDNTQVFKGIITKHTVKVGSNGNTELRIECRDEIVRMTIGRHSRYYQKIKDSTLVDNLVSFYPGLQSEAQATKLEHKELVQHHVSDWDFLLMRAEASGMLVHAYQGKVKTLKPDTGSEPVLQINYGSSIMEFEAEIDARTQWKSVKASSWDYAGQHLFTAETSEAKGFTQHGNISGSDLANGVNAKLEHYEMRHSGHLLQQELQDWTDGLMLRSRLAKIRGNAKITGFAGIQPTDMVKISGVGDRFNGNAFVSGVTHEIVQGAWKTHIQFGIDPERYANVFKNIADPLSSGLMPAVHGLQIGIVVHLATDPDGDDRIQVKIPVIDTDAEGIWCRVACLDAGDQRGTFFRPELNDEVIVGFINDDPRHAVILGQLNSSAKPAPLQATDENDEKGIFTRSKMRIHFNDKTKTITVDTPAGNSVMLDEEGKTIKIKDQNDNKITLSTSGIVMDSPKDIEIKAGANLTLSAGAQLKIGGMSVSVKADSSLGLEGAVAKLSSSGITEVKGSLVKIN